LKTGFRAKDAKNAKKLLRGELVGFVYESFDVTFEELTAKVYQQSKFKVRKFQIRKNLLLVDAGEGLDGFQLNQNYVSNNQIRTKAFIESLPAKANWNWLLSLYTKPTLSKRVRQQHFVHRFQKPGS